MIYHRGRQQAQGHVQLATETVLSLAFTSIETSTPHSAPPPPPEMATGGVKPQIWPCRACASMCLGVSSASDFFFKEWRKQ